jgi:hypothetical protein
MRLAASEPVIELEPVGQEQPGATPPPVHKPSDDAPGAVELEPADAPEVGKLEPDDAPILAELDRDEDGPTAAGLDEDAPHAIFPKKKDKEPSLGRTRPSALRLAPALGAVAVAILAAGFFLYRARNTSEKQVPNEQPVASPLEQKGAVLERDMDSPDKPVIGITFTGTAFRPSDMDYIKAYPTLRRLNLSRTSVGNSDLEKLEGLADLEDLNLSATKVSDAGMASLKKLVNLRKLDLGDTIVTDSGLEKLRGLSKLQELVLVGSLANGERLKGALPKLRVFIGVDRKTTTVGP